MMCRINGLRLPTLVIATLAVLAAVGSAAESTAEFVRSSLEDQAVVRTKAEHSIVASLASQAENAGLDEMRVWVFFTDKGVTDQTDFDRAAADVTLTDRALTRRAKVGRDQVVFADLPVVQTYVDAVEAIGASHRRSSRWLNAATFLVPVDRLEYVARLPFVAEIRPMAVYKRDLPDPEGSRTPEGSGALSPDALSYGSALAQLTQINVPAVHDLGYTGAGVTLAIMDTGYRKSHAAFAQHIANNRVLAEWDFIFNDNNTENEPGDGDVSSQWNHGTYIWSVSAGEDSGSLYGPAYHSNIILCKTEDVRSETQVEEDNWVAALEFSDSVGTDVITTSLGYSSFDNGFSYTYEDMDGQTAVISIAASTCDGLGIVMCNSMGNSGPSAGSLSAPADALDILSVGNVNSAGTISFSSSRGPTFDGRIKPEVCARGSATACAAPWDDVSYTSASGTSLSTPLVAGAVCLVIEAHPEWTPAQVREALKMTASQAESPDNDYGWGIINVLAAINYSFDTSCCVGTVGDVDGEGGDEVVLADLTALIDHLFISLAPVPCLEEADMDLSGQPDPVPGDVSLADLTVIIDHLFVTLDPLPACP